jgi:hypothetical protein
MTHSPRSSWSADAERDGSEQLREETAALRREAAELLSRSRWWRDELHRELLSRRRWQGVRSAVGGATPQGRDDGGT